MTIMADENYASNHQVSHSIHIRHTRYVPLCYVSVKGICKCKPIENKLTTLWAHNYAADENYGSNHQVSHMIHIRHTRYVPLWYISVKGICIRKPIENKFMTSWAHDYMADENYTSNHQTSHLIHIRHTRYVPLWYVSVKDICTPKPIENKLMTSWAHDYMADENYASNHQVSH